MGYLEIDTVDDDDFEERFEEFNKMTEAQQEAEIAREMAAYNEWWDGLTPLRRYRISRRSALEGCMVWRRTIRSLGGEPRDPDDFFVQQLRQRQKRLLKLRIERATGVRPGTA